MRVLRLRAKIETDHRGLIYDVKVENGRVSVTRTVGMRPTSEYENPLQQAFEMIERED